MINRKFLLFSSQNCSACKLVKEVLSKTSLPVETVNVEENPGRAHDHRVMSIPHLVFLENGREVDVTVGYSPKVEQAIINFAFPSFTGE